MVTAVLAAALEVFAERGYAGLSVEEVALRASVNKTTVYRRWPTKAELVQAALLRLRDEDAAVPDGGSLRDDLFVLLRARVARWSTPRGRNLARAVLLGAADPELAGLLSALRRARPSIPQLVIDRAIARGELPKRTDAAFVGDSLLALVHGRLFWRGEKVTARDLRRIIELIVTGASHGGAKS